MSATMITPMVADALAASLKKKKVLLVDGSPKQRDLRAETMRKLGMDVDIAIDISEARAWWRADLYNLVLFNVENELGYRDKFCQEIRNATPPQQLAFLVGKPGYLADLPNADGWALAQDDVDPTIIGDKKAALPGGISGDSPLRWGILEASRRISQVRSLSHARSKAVRERPEPVRDSETQRSKRPNGRTLDELLREEMQ